MLQVLRYIEGYCDNLTTNSQILTIQNFCELFWRKFFQNEHQSCFSQGMRAQRGKCFLTKITFTLFWCVNSLISLLRILSFETQYFPGAYFIICLVRIWCVNSLVRNFYRPVVMFVNCNFHFKIGVGNTDLI